MENTIKICGQNNNLTEIERKNIDTSNILATPLKVSNELLLIAYWYDFVMDGFKVIRISDITNIIQNESIEFIKMIFEKEKIKADELDIQTINISSWYSFFKEIKKEQQIVIVESERKTDSDFYIGRIEMVEDNNLKLLCFDTAGNWDNEASIIGYSNITCVTFQDRYSSYMGKYALNSLK